MWTRPLYSPCERKGKPYYKQAAKEVARDKATSSLSPEVLHVNNLGQEHWIYTVTIRNSPLHSFALLTYHGRRTGHCKSCSSTAQALLQPAQPPVAGPNNPVEPNPAPLQLYSFSFLLVLLLLFRVFWLASPPRCSRRSVFICYR